MGIIKQTSIHHRFTYGLIFIIVSTMVVFSSVLVSFNFKLNEKKQSDIFNSMVERAQISLPGALWQFNHEYVNNYIDALFLNRDFVFASVTSNNVPIKIKHHPKYQDGSPSEFESGSRFMIRKIHIKYKGYPVGQIVLVMSKDRIRSRMIKESVLMIFMMFLNVVAIFITTYILSKQNIFKPLADFTSIIGEISKGNLEKKVPRSGTVEIDALATAFEQMMNHLNATMASKQELEQEVKERRLAQEKSSMLGRILEDSLNEVYIFDAQTLKYIVVNQGARNNIGYSMDELYEMTPLDIEPDYTETTFRQMLRPLLSGVENAIRFNTRLQRKDGSQYKTAVHLQLMRFQAVAVGVAIILDITDQEAAREKLLASVAEKEVLLKEIHHRVKNNMQIIQSLLNLQTGKTDNTLLKSALQDAIQRIKSMALIHETLYRSDDLALLDLNIYFKSIISYLENIYRTPETHVDILTDIQPVKLDIDRSISCGLILNELVSNAFKYAFKTTNKGRICIKFKARENSTAQLIVSDNGCGMPVETKTPDSLGLGLVKILAQDQLEGELTVSQKQKKELSFTIEFPLIDEE